MAETAFIRAFIAINLPVEVRANLAELQHELKSALSGDGLRWTKPEQIHLTLKFLGDVAADSLKDLKVAVQRACEGITPFFLCTESLGVFPDSQRPRVIWTDVSGDTDIFRRLQEQVERETCAWREAEQRIFQPHLTLARVRSLKPDGAAVLREKIRVHATTQFGSWRVTQIDLMQGKLSGAAASVNHRQSAGNKGSRLFVEFNFENGFCPFTSE
jgi:2'-5' RNA ligase